MSQRCVLSAMGAPVEGRVLPAARGGLSEARTVPTCRVQPRRETATPTDPVLGLCVRTACHSGRAQTEVHSGVARAEGPSRGDTQVGG